MNLISLTEIANQCTRRTPPTWTHEYAMTRITQLVQAEVEAAIEATKENESKVYHRLVESAVAHAIEATKAKVLECYSPDDTYQDWVDKIKEIK